jgi:hypothetical protein
MGLAGFALARGGGGVGLALFHGWEVDWQLSLRLAARDEAAARAARAEQEHARAVLPHPTSPTAGESVERQHSEVI